MQQKWEITHLLKRAGVTDTMTALSSAKDEASPSTSGAGAKVREAVQQQVLVQR